MRAVKIATWNVNSLTVRLPQVLEWVAAEGPDVLALQETKIVDAKFPRAEIEAAGYHVVYSGQKTYNGVALLSRTPPADVAADIPGLDGEQRRVLAASYGKLRVVNLYVPNGESVGSEKYAFKLDWLKALTRYVRQQLAAHARLIVLGDFNIAPDERDVHDPSLWEGRVLFSGPERTAFHKLIDAGLCDTFRLFEQRAQEFSWWDYRMGAFRRNRGLRIDHVLASDALCKRCRACRIDQRPRALGRPSDHAPVIAEFEIA